MNVKSNEARLFLLSLILLFGEILAIRWLSIEVSLARVFPNLILLVVLVAASAGMGAPQRYKLSAGWLVAAVSIIFSLMIFAVPLQIPHLSIKLGIASPLSIVISLLLLILLVACLLVIFLVVGAKMGELFAALPPLKAYSINLLGSIAGVVLIAMISLFQLPPPVWILIAGLITWLTVRHKLVPVLTIGFAIAASFTTLSSFWSPYSKLDVVDLNVPATSALGKGNYVLNSNNHYFHFALRMLDDQAARRFALEPDSNQKQTVQHYFDFLRVPFLCAPRHDRVLVLGGGSGNDVAYAIGHGAKHVTVVEIDPVISRLGKTAHPDRPYIDPRVSLHTDDARNYLRYSKEKFDLIEFAYLDPGATLNTASFVRVDNFVYTVESIRSALNHLDDRGLLSISFATGGEHPVTRRLYQTISEALGHAPVTYVDDKWKSVLFFAGPGADHLNLSESELHGLRKWPGEGEKTGSRSSHDDWPFLYLEYDASGVILYVGILLVTIVMPALLLTKGGDGAITGGAWGNMFFLGQSFMLVETKSIAQISLFFGATWLVSSVVIACVLVLAFIANSIAGRIKTEKIYPFYIALAASLVLSLLFDIPTDSQVHPLLLAIVATLISCLPILFGGLIFSLCFRRANAPALYLSANLLGVAIGGLTENLSIAVGIKGLTVIAMILYGLSYLSLRIRPPVSRDTVPGAKAD